MEEGKYYFHVMGNSPEKIYQAMFYISKSLMVEHLETRRKTYEYSVTFFVWALLF